MCALIVGFQGLAFIGVDIIPFSTSMKKISNHKMLYVCIEIKLYENASGMPNPDLFQIKLSTNFNYRHIGIPKPTYSF